MPQEWSNWSGSLRFLPDRIEHPADEAAVARIVAGAHRDGRTVRAVGAGHSSSALVETQEVLVSLDKHQGIVSHDAEAREATLRAGMTLHDASEALLDGGLAMPNLGDVDVQTVVGAVGTGTHGSGMKLQNLASPLVGGTLVTGTGEVRNFSIEKDGDLLRAIRVSLGALGVLTEMRLRLVPAFRLRRQERCGRVDDLMPRLDELARRHRNVDFYWYPRSDEAKLRVHDVEGSATEEVDFGVPVVDRTDWSGRILPRTRDLKFDEMEYALPYDEGPACFEQVRRRVKARHRKEVGWRILYRFVAADDAYLSPHHGRDSVTISLHHNAGLPFWDYFHDIEPIFREHGGRPHWGKKHTMTARELRPLYPEWDRFQRERKRLDPDGIFLNAHLRGLLVEDEP